MGSSSAFAEYCSSATFDGDMSTVVSSPWQRSNALRIANLQAEAMANRERSIQASGMTFQSQSPQIGAKEQRSMLRELTGDLRGFIKDNRDLIFSVLMVLVLDHYVFAGAFRERLKGVVEGVLHKAETKAKGETPAS